MLMLVTADNFIQMFIGWEGVGLASFLLINFWTTRLQAGRAAMKALIVNRIGDFGLSLGIFAIFFVYGAVDYSTVFALSAHIDAPYYIWIGADFCLSARDFIGICLFIGAVGKSAQIGLHTWLPDAMEGFWALLKFHHVLESPRLILKSDGLRSAEQSLGICAHFGAPAPSTRAVTNINEVNQHEAAISRMAGSSETLRETLKDTIFIRWFIGFTEGDGSFITNRDGSLEFKVTQSSSDVQVLYFIKKKLGFGQVALQDKNSNTHHFRVRDKNGLSKLIEIFNGNLCTSYKKTQFKIWLQAWNTRYAEVGRPSHEDLRAPSDNNKKPQLNDSWLAGFSDAEGCFTCSIRPSKQIQLRFILSQKGEKDLLEHVGRLVNGRLSYLKSYGGYNLTVNLIYLQTVIKYFQRFKLKTKKRVSYLKWLQIYKIKIQAIKNKTKLTPLEFQKIDILRKSINLKASKDATNQVSQ